MKHQLLESVEVMIATEMLSRISGEAITSAAQQPITPEYGRSGSKILLLTTNENKGPRFILKRVSLAWDWLMRSTEDTYCRAVTLWQYGLFDLMPLEVAHGVLACAHDNGGWAILMKDVGDRILPFEPFKESDNAFFLDAMAAFHAQFWRMAALHNPQLGLCAPRHLYQMFSPVNATREAKGANDIPRRVLEGWALVNKELPQDITALLRQLLADPSPLCRALEKLPGTLIHGDWRHANQAYAPEHGKVYLLDWQLAATAPPAVELARYLITNSPLLPVTKEAAIEMYRHQLATRLGKRYSQDWWEPQLALGLLGGFLQDAWALVLKAAYWHIGEKHRAHWRADIDWWCDQVRKGIQWL